MIYVINFNLLVLHLLTSINVSIASVWQYYFSSPIRKLHPEGVCRTHYALTNLPYHCACPSHTYYKQPDSLKIRKTSNISIPPNNLLSCSNRSDTAKSPRPCQISIAVHFRIRTARRATSQSKRSFLFFSLRNKSNHFSFLKILPRKQSSTTITG